MPKRLGNLIMQDMTVAIRNYFHFVILFLATIMIILVNFAIPETVKLTPAEFYFDSTESKVLEQFLVEHDVEASRIFDSREALLAAVEKDNNSLGIILAGSLEEAKFTIIHQGTESNEILNLLDVTLQGALDEMRGITRHTDHRVELLRPKSSPIPFNKNLIPILMITEVVMLGFLLIAVMVFQEKDDGSVKAYRVSPGGTVEYILSKTIVNVILAVVYGTLVTLFTMGFTVNYGLLIMVFVLASTFMTLLGLAVSAFFRNFQEFLFVGVGVIALLGMPMASYLYPSFTPAWMTWLPSYAVLFGIREILFPTGKLDYVWSLNGLLLVQGIVLFGLSYLAVKRNLMREGR